MKYICLFISLILLIEIPALGSVPPQVLSGKEIVWSGEVELKNDVIVPEGSTLTIKPGTKIYGVYETKEAGFTPDEWKIIVKGELIAEGELDNPIVFDPIPYGRSSIRVPVSSELESITISPQQIDTKEIKDEFVIFRTQYVLLWTLLFGSIYYAIKSRKD